MIYVLRSKRCGSHTPAGRVERSAQSHAHSRGVEPRGRLAVQKHALARHGRQAVRLAQPADIVHVVVSKEVRCRTRPPRPRVRRRSAFRRESQPVQPERAPGQQHVSAHLAPQSLQEHALRLAAFEIPSLANQRRERQDDKPHRHHQSLQKHVQLRVHATARHHLPTFVVVEQLDRLDRR